jgi:hypothetical protein
MQYFFSAVFMDFKTRQELCSTHGIRDLESDDYDKELLNLETFLGKFFLEKVNIEGHSCL